MPPVKVHFHFEKGFPLSGKREYTVSDESVHYMKYRMYVCMYETFQHIRCLVGPQLRGGRLANNFVRHTFPLRTKLFACSS